MPFKFVQYNQKNNTPKQKAKVKPHTKKSAAVHAHVLFVIGFNTTKQN